jgi:hypothetical protein
MQPKTLGRAALLYLLHTSVACSEPNPPIGQHVSDSHIPPKANTSLSAVLGTQLSVLSLDLNCLQQDEFKTAYEAMQKNAVAHGHELSSDALTALVSLMQGPGDTGDAGIKQKRDCLSKYKAYQEGR